MPSTSQPLPETQADPDRWRALGVLALAVCLIVIDGTIVNVALPTMMTSLPLTFSQAQWTTTIYSLLFAALLIATGRLGDRYGRRTTLDAGLVLFAVGSLLAGLAHGATTLLVARAVQGVGGALVLPSTLSTVNATFRGRERANAFGAWGATISGAAAIGPLLGGWLTSSYSWRWVFAINLPLTALIAVGAHLWVRQTRSEDAHSAVPGTDVVGLVLSSLGMGGVVFGLIEGRSLGWWHPLTGTWASAWFLSPAPAAIVLGAACLAGFILVESRRRADGAEVLLDVSLFRLSSFAWGNTAALVVAMGEFGLLFVLPLYLQNVRSLSAIEAGWVLVAMALGAFASGAAAGPLARRTTPADVSTTGLALEALGVAGLALFLRADSPLWHVIVPLVVYGAGLGMASAQLTGTILADVPTSQSGQGSATQSTFRQLGSALGTAVIATLLASGVGAGASGSLTSSEVAAALPPAVATGLEEALAPSAGSVVEAVRQGSGQASAVPSQVRQEVADVLAEDFTRGARLPLWAGAGFLTLGVVATTRLPRRKV